MCSPFKADGYNSCKSVSALWPGSLIKLGSSQFMATIVEGGENEASI